MIAYVLTPIFVVAVVTTLLVWHPVLAISRWLHAGLHYLLLDVGVGALVFHLRLIGYKVEITGLSLLPKKGPVVLVSSHQSFYDIPLVLWYMRHLRPKFVAKKELARGFPCASLILRTGGSALIDRKSPTQAIPTIEALGRRIAADQSAACIFPEGTRARDGRLKTFKASGVEALMRGAPTAQVFPLVIDGTFRIFERNLLPVPTGGVITLRVLPAIPWEPSRGQEGVKLLHAKIEEAISVERLSRAARRPAP